MPVVSVESKSKTRRRVSKKVKVTKELLEQLYWKKGLSIRQIAGRVGLAPTTVCRVMSRYGIPRREIRRFIVDEVELDKLYWNQRFGFDPVTVLKAMRRFGIPRRSLSEAFSIAKMKYPKTPFSCNLLEKAHLLGLRTGDLTSRKHGFQVVLTTGTTHPAMVRLLHGLFDKYGHVRETPGKMGGSSGRTYYGYWVSICVDRSFEFLLEKPRKIPKGVMDRSESFLAFLAGYADAEGTPLIENDKGYVAFGFAISSKDKGILQDLHRGLRQLGFHLNLNPDNYVQDYWRLRIRRKNEVARLLSLLPLKHDEKVRRKALMLEVQDAKKWSNVAAKVFDLHESIVREVADFKRQAKEEYGRRHRAHSLGHKKDD